MPTSRSPTRCSSRRLPGSRRSSSRVARSATRWRSSSPTGITWPWSSPVAATSGIDGYLRPRPAQALATRARAHLRAHAAPRERVRGGRNDASARISEVVMELDRPSHAAMEKLLALEMAYVTEAAAIASARLMGRGDRHEADRLATEAMRAAMDEVEMHG